MTMWPSQVSWVLNPGLFLTLRVTLLTPWVPSLWTSCEAGEPEDSLVYIPLPSGLLTDNAMLATAKLILLTV